MSEAELSSSTVVAPLSEALIENLLALAPQTAHTDLFRSCLKSLCDALSAGHVCIDISRLAASAEVTCNAYLKALAESDLVGEPGDFAPLVLDGTRLYLARYWYYENLLASDLIRRLKHPLPAIDETRLAADLNHYFPPSEAKPDWQKVAAARAVLQRVCVISGGPGTGKTATVLRILAVLQSMSDSPLRMALAAPTGKAAARMQEALMNGRKKLLDDLLFPEIPMAASTLHRLLGSNPESGYFRYNRGHPLTCDVAVVDEASMIDLPMMARLLDALPLDARLILLGDRNQLASVEAGSVFHDLCAQQGNDAAFAEKLQRVTGVNIPVAELPSPLGNSISLLQHSYRFRADSGIGALATAINQGDASKVAKVMAADGYSDVTRLDGEKVALQEQLLAGYDAYWQAIESGASVAEMFATFSQFQVLAAQREGRLGVVGLNALIERWLTRRGIKPVDDAWYAGRPVMITQNDYANQLFNGDIGITVLNEQGKLRVWFETEGGGFRSLPPSWLPAHQTVFAMTVHKSQGSEFDQVMLVMPDVASDLLDRTLFYTAVTRARRQVCITGKSDLIRRAVEKRPIRYSGLAERLREALI